MEGPHAGLKIRTSLVHPCLQTCILKTSLSPTVWTYFWDNEHTHLIIEQLDKNPSRFIESSKVQHAQLQKPLLERLLQPRSCSQENNRCHIFSRKSGDILYDFKFTFRIADPEFHLWDFILLEA